MSVSGVAHNAYLTDPGRVHKYAMHVQYFERWPRSKIVSDQGVYKVSFWIAHSLAAVMTCRARQFQVDFSEAQALGHIFILHSDYFASLTRMN